MNPGKDNAVGIFSTIATCPTLRKTEAISAWFESCSFLGILNYIILHLGVE